MSIVLQGASLNAEHKYKLVVVGGGAGGCGTANKFVGKFGKGEVCVIGNNQKLSILLSTLLLQTKAIRRFVITQKAPTRTFSWLKAATTAFTFKTLLRHHAKRTMTPW